MRVVSIALAVASVVTACSNSGSGENGAVDESVGREEVSAGAGTVTTPVDDRPLSPEAAEAVDRAVTDASRFVGEPLLLPLDPEVFADLATIDDARAGWILVDLGQFVFRGEAVDGLIAAANGLAGPRPDGEGFTIRTWWKGLGDHLITADVPAPPGYLDLKRELYGAADTTFIRLLDADATIDWRQVSFGGVLADNRPYGSDETCFCITALDEPPTISAAEADWYPDHRAVFGVEVNGEYRAYPINVMEAHELVNDVLGRRPISLTYCTLCRSAVAYLLDDLPDGVERPVLRTSGLLQRSNKLVFDRTTSSLIDQFTGEALSGPLAEAGLVLPRVTVVTSRWDDWRTAHPETTFMNGRANNAEDYPFDSLLDRDGEGPVFPVGAFADDLRAIQPVVGTVSDLRTVSDPGTVSDLGADEPTIAFSVDGLRAAAEAGETVTHRGVTAVPEGSGFRLVDADGRDLQSSQASWFAWIQRFPDTDLWQP